MIYKMYSCTKPSDVQYNVWLAAVPPCDGFAGWLFGGMESSRRGSASPRLLALPL